MIDKMHNNCKGGECVSCEFERREAVEAGLIAPEDSTGEVCGICNREYMVNYMVPNDLWPLIAPNKDTLGPHPEHQGGGLLCPDCAHQKARELGITLLFTAQPAEIERLKEAFTWSLRHTSGKELRRMVGDLSDTSNLDEFICATARAALSKEGE